jgi:hypothetical protein
LPGDLGDPVEVLVVMANREAHRFSGGGVSGKI